MIIGLQKIYYVLLLHRFAPPYKNSNYKSILKGYLPMGNIHIWKKAVNLALPVYDKLLLRKVTPEVAKHSGVYFTFQLLQFIALVLPMPTCL